MPTLFISYSSANKRFAERLAHDLLRAGIDIWLDRWEIRVGDSIVEKISDGISENDFIAIVLSPASVESPWVARELNSSLRRKLDDQNVQLLPILYKSCDIPDIIADIKYADFRKNYQKGLRELLEAIFPQRYRPTYSLNVHEKLQKLIEDVQRNPWDQEPASIEPIVRELRRVVGLEPQQIVDALINIVEYKYGDITHFTIYQAVPSIFESIARDYPMLKPQISAKLLEMLRYRLFLPWSEILHSEKSPIISAMIEACGPEAISTIERELAERGTDDSFYTEELVVVLRKYGVEAKSCIPQLTRIYRGFGDESSPGAREAIAQTLGDIADDKDTIAFLEKAAQVEKKLMAENPEQQQWVQEFDINVDYAIRTAIQKIRTRRMFTDRSSSAP